ncbi:16S rRNA (guanine(527)-N(7))-methyltransferase RsmG [Fulvivirga sp. M361]|uniref:16S rRNA (guanine(527)-N(7))-methyltransferase RsmG n=1 Tax=Fulvivirga sp. M361 TaxID=2594266 RepID=UPI001179C3B4|nr:16S rRNA (guanine(527)-N(7))-methyltransferase RsmG [Fulvivirga sp. M361]TRX55958.1 16S rRNA (guanine(527)-N(7))-methyltransferase RsmG [Fulvivirga sp. M361]
MSADILFEHFPALSTVQKDQFTRLESLYKEWNEKINVVSRKDIDELYVRHVLHSLGIAKVIDFKPGTKILDVGTGGGFPGIPLAILFPKCQFHLVDSIGKKIKVVNEVKDALGLKNVTAEQTRAEQVTEKYHFVVSRAVTRMKPFYQWIKSKFAPDSFNELNNGVLYLKGGDLKEELKESRLPYQSISLSEYFSDPFFDTKKVVYIPIVR